MTKKYKEDEIFVGKRIDHEGVIYRRLIMKLTKNDKELLKEYGFEDRDMAQIERATSKTNYTLNYNNRISAKRAIELLGRKTYLSGIARSAFHYSAVRQVEDSDDKVFFDSSRLFRT